jgi:DNA-binding NtrC family response regulator
MESSAIVVVHQELDEQKRIGDTLAELGRPIEFASDFHGLVRILRSTRVGLVVSGRIKVPREKPKVVEGIQRNSLRIPVLVLVNHPSDIKHPRFTELLLGLQNYLLWPEATDDLPVAAQSLLWTASMADGVSEQPGEPGWIPALRGAAEVRERQDLIAALRANNGNITKAAAMLGISRGGLQYRMRKHGVQPAKKGGRRRR